MNFQAEALDLLGDIGSNVENLGFLSKRLDRLIPFVGAGLSVDFNYPTWGTLLQRIANDHGVCDQVRHLIESRSFEEAAETIEQLAPGVIDAEIRTIFNPNGLPKPLDKGAVRHIPGFSDAFVITTNFDGVLEGAFKDAGKPFLDVFPGTRIVLASAAIHDSSQVLLKLHGSYEEPEHRVLTLTQYARQYGPDAEGVDLMRPLPNVLQQALGSRPMLFLGCSLQNDRTTRVIANLVERLPGLTHFALLAEQENTPERVAQLRRWKIYPLFFRGIEFGRVEQFVKLLARAVRREGRNDDVTMILNRIISRELQSHSGLKRTLMTTVLFGTVIVASAFLVETQTAVTAMLGGGAFVMTAAASWAITTQLRVSRSQVTMLEGIRDGIELCCPKQPDCCEKFWNKLLELVKRTAGIHE